MVSNAREDLPDPDRPVKTTSASRGRSSETSFRLCSRAPRTISRSLTHAMLGATTDSLRFERVNPSAPRSAAGEKGSPTAQILSLTAPPGPIRGLHPDCTHDFGRASTGALVARESTAGCPFFPIGRVMIYRRRVRSPGAVAHLRPAAGVAGYVHGLQRRSQPRRAGGRT